MPATRANQLIIALSVIGGIAVVYKFIKEIGGDIIALLKKIHEEIKALAERTQWVDEIREKFPDSTVIVDKLKRMNGDTNK